jgi:hypothetical protein
MAWVLCARIVRRRISKDHAMTQRTKRAARDTIGGGVRADMSRRGEPSFRALALPMSAPRDLTDTTWEKTPC